jgi:excisionase family DNA binding protein
MPLTDHLSTLEVARMLGMAVRSVQLMVDRGELRAWKTPGGHRRIDRASVEQWQSGRREGADYAPPAAPTAPAAPASGGVPSRRITDSGDKTKVLLIEDSLHYQNLVGLLLRQKFPDVQLRTTGDGVSGLAMVGLFQPHVLMVDILLPGIDGGTLISSLRMHEQFRDLRVIVITSLSLEQLEPYAFALQDLPVVHKSNLVTELPEVLATCIGQVRRGAAKA